MTSVITQKCHDEFMHAHHDLLLAYGLGGSDVAWNASALITELSLQAWRRLPFEQSNMLGHEREVELMAAGHVTLIILMKGAAPETLQHFVECVDKLKPAFDDVPDEVVVRFLGIYDSRVVPTSKDTPGGSVGHSLLWFLGACTIMAYERDNKLLRNLCII